MSDISSNDKKRLYSLFSELKTEGEKVPSPRTTNSDILIVDGLNSFIRAYSAVPSMNENGNHVGGIAGFLKSVGFAVKLLNPTKVIVVFDGVGGSKKRREIYPEYKDGRKTKIRLNRSYLHGSENIDEDDSLKVQLSRTFTYLNTLPVKTIAIDNVEADDTIAFLAREQFKDSNNVYIMSSDKDFLQLVDDRVKVWSPTKKKLYGCAEILIEFGISCQNFINYRVMEGDDSDNISGIRGAGLKTIKKCFPFLNESKRYELKEIYNYCESHSADYKLYSTILENKQIMERNWKLMQLFDSQIPGFAQLRIMDSMNGEFPKLNRVEFIKLLTEDRMWANLPNGNLWLTETWSKVNSMVL